MSACASFLQENYTLVPTFPNCQYFLLYDVKRFVFFALTHVNVILGVNIPLDATHLSEN